MQPIRIAVLGSPSRTTRDALNGIQESDITCLILPDIETLIRSGADAPDLVLVDDVFIGQEHVHLPIQIPVILLEGDSSSGFTADGLVQTIRKPFSSDQLHQLIRHILRKRTVLIVDDTATVRELICREFPTSHFSVETAATGLEGYRKAREMLPDLVTMDVEMPEMDGYKACEMIRNDPVTAHIPIVFVTTLASEEGMERGFRAGAVEYFVKPFKPGTLCHFASELIRRLESRKTRKLGVVDNCLRSAGVVGHILSKNGFDVTIGKTGHEVRHTMAPDNPEMVIVNLDMDDEKPENLIQETRQLWPNIPVIGFTSRDRKSIIIRSLQAGAVDYLHAPFVEEELLRRVETHLDFYALMYKLNQANSRLRELSVTDPLTGLYNRGFLATTLKREIKQLSRRHDWLSCIMLDIDHFKSINDKHGHLAGDHVLIHLAKLLQGLTRDTDYTVRYGGEEFALLLPQTDIAGARILAEKIRKTVEKARFRYGDTVVRLTVSCGVHGIQNFLDGANLLKYTDEALYHAKQTGRNKVSTYENI